MILWSMWIRFIDIGFWLQMLQNARLSRGVLDRWLCIQTGPHMFTTEHQLLNSSFPRMGISTSQQISATFKIHCICVHLCKSCFKLKFCLRVFLQSVKLRNTKFISNNFEVKFKFWIAVFLQNVLSVWDASRKMIFCGLKW